jgi:hypothetical protein
MKSLTAVIVRLVSTLLDSARGAIYGPSPCRHGLERGTMCGIAGFISGRSQSSAGHFSNIAGSMGGSLQHRGPDDHGTWIDTEAGVVLVHRRLAIIDLSSAGHQPMVSADGRYVISYNGEIYNHEEIRPSLLTRGCTFRGHSDTEVMLESFSAFGLDATLPRLIGMFAFALWDRRERTLTQARPAWHQAALLGQVRRPLCSAPSQARAPTRPSVRRSIEAQSQASCGTITFRRRTRSIKASTSSSPARC